MTSKPQFGSDFLDIAYGTTPQGGVGASSDPFLDIAYGAYGENPGSWGGDFGASILGGGNALVSMVGGLYGLTTGDMDNPVYQWAKENKASIDAIKSDELRARERQLQQSINSSDTLPGQAWNAVWGTVSDPYLMANFVAEQLPLLATTGLVGLGVKGGAALLGAGVKAATRAGTAGAALTSGAMNASDIATGTYEQIKSLPDYIWDGNQEYLDLSLEIGAEAAKEQIALRQAREVAKVVGPLSAATTLLPGSIEKTIVGDVGIAKGGVLKGAGFGILGEGAQEVIEEGGGQFASNIAVRGVDPSQDILEGVGGAAGTAFALGGAIGGVGGGIGGALRSDYDPFAGKEPSQVLEELQARAGALNARIESGLDADAVEVQRAGLEADARRARLTFPGFTFDLGGILDPISTAAKAGQAEARAQGGDGLDQANNAAARVAQTASQPRIIETPTTQAVIETDSPQIADNFEQQVQETEANRQEQMAALTPGVDLIASLRASLNKAIITARREQRALGDSDPQQTQELEDDISRLQLGLTRLQEAQRYAAEGNSAAIPTILNQVRGIAARPILSPEFGRRQAFDYVNVLEGELMPRMDETIELYQQAGVMPQTERPALRAPADFEVDPEGSTRRPRSTTQQADIPDIRARDNLIEDQNIIYGDQPPPEPTPPGPALIENQNIIYGQPPADQPTNPARVTRVKASGDVYPTAKSAEIAMSRLQREEQLYRWEVVTEGSGFAVQGSLIKPSERERIKEVTPSRVIDQAQQDQRQVIEMENLPPNRLSIADEIAVFERGAGVAYEKLNGIEQRLNALTARDQSGLTKKNPALTVKDGDDLILTIVKLGGIDSDLAAANGFEPKLDNPRSNSVGRYRLFRKNGRTFDDLAISLRDEGWYPQADPNMPDTLSANDVMEDIREAVNLAQGNTFVYKSDKAASILSLENDKEFTQEMIDEFEALVATYRSEVGPEEAGLSDAAVLDSINYFNEVREEFRDEISGALPEGTATASRDLQTSERRGDSGAALEPAGSQPGATEATQAGSEESLATARSRVPPDVDQTEETETEPQGSVSRSGARESTKFMSDTGRPLLRSYSERELRRRDKAAAEAAERREQIDRERELFDLNPGEGTISGTADPTQTDAGQGSLFRESAGDIGRVSDRQIEDTINRIVGDNQAARNNIIVVGRFDDLPQNVRDDAKSQGLNNVAAAVNDGKVYIVRNRMVDEAHVERAILHEATHVGAAKMYADEGVEKALNRMFVAMGGKKGFNKIVADLGLEDRIAPYRDGLEQSNYSGEVRNRILVEEVLANVGEQGSKTFKLRVQEAIGAIREWLRRNGFATLADLGVTDIVYASKQARTAFSEALGGTMDAADSRFSDTQEGRRSRRDDFNFYSGIEEILLTKGDKIFKASKRNPDALVRGDQILSFLNSQGMKPDEARFSRIEQFLEPETRYSRQQILDYMEGEGRPRYTEYQAVSDSEMDDVEPTGPTGRDLTNMFDVDDETLFTGEAETDEALIDDQVEQAFEGFNDDLLEAAVYNTLNGLRAGRRAPQEDSESPARQFASKIMPEGEDKLDNYINALLEVKSAEELSDPDLSFMDQANLVEQQMRDLPQELNELVRQEAERVAKREGEQDPFMVFKVSIPVLDAVGDSNRFSDNDQKSLASYIISGREDSGWTIQSLRFKGRLTGTTYPNELPDPNTGRREPDTVVERGLDQTSDSLDEAFIRVRDDIQNYAYMESETPRGKLSAKFRQYFDENLDNEDNWENYREFTLEVENNVWGQYQGSHFDVNTLYDVITTDRTFDPSAASESAKRRGTAYFPRKNEYLGGQALFVEEAQSDWSTALRRQRVNVNRLDPDYDEQVQRLSREFVDAKDAYREVEQKIEESADRIREYDRRVSDADNSPGLPPQTSVSKAGIKGNRLRVSSDTNFLGVFLTDLDTNLTQEGEYRLFELTAPATDLIEEDGSSLPYEMDVDELVRMGAIGSNKGLRIAQRTIVEQMFREGSEKHFAPGLVGDANTEARMNLLEQFDRPINDDVSILRYAIYKHRVLGISPAQVKDRLPLSFRQQDLSVELFEREKLQQEEFRLLLVMEDAETDYLSARDNKMTPMMPLPGDKYIRLAAQRAFATAAEEGKDYLAFTHSSRPGIRWNRDYVPIYDQKWLKEIKKVSGSDPVPITIYGKVANAELELAEKTLAQAKVTAELKRSYDEGASGGSIQDRYGTEHKVTFEFAAPLKAGETKQGEPVSTDIRVFGSKNQKEAIKKAEFQFRNAMYDGLGIAGWAVPITEQAVEKQRSEGISLFLNEPAPFQKENERIREQNVTLVEKVKQKAKRELAPGGLLPKAVFDEKITRDNQLATVEFDTVYYVKQLEKAVKSTMGGAIEELPADQQARLSEALAGKLDDSLPKSVKEAIIGMRESIDGLSREYVKILDRQTGELLSQFSGPQRELLDAYMRASEADNKREANAILDQAKAQFRESAEAEGLSTDLRQPITDIQKVMSQLSLLNVIRSNTGTYVNRSYRAFDDSNWFENVPDKVLNDARRYLSSRMEESGMNPDRIAERVEVVLNDILKEGTAYGSMESFIKESKLGAKDLSILQKRKDIAPEIRALLGEYEDPRVNYAKTTAKMARLIHNTRFLDKVKEIGMGNFLFTDDNRPPNTTLIAVEGNKSLEPLNGLYAPRDVAQAFSDVGKVRDFIGMPESIIRLNGGIKFGKTVLAPTTQFRNFMSASFFAMANGHWDPRKMAKSLSVMREYFTRDGNKGKLAYLRRLKELGVVYDTPFAGEMMRLLDETRIFDAERAEMGAFRGTVKDVATAAQRMYQFGDDFWKIVGYENEKASLIGTGMSEAEAEVEAANRIRNTYPTYSLVGHFVNAMRRFPLAGTFVSFPAEIIRTQYNMIKIAAEDMQTPGRRALGVKRLIGMSMAAASAYAVQSLTKEMFDVSDDEEEAVRLMAPYWAENSNLLFMGRNKDGQLEYLDVSFMDPYNYFKRPINAVLRDQPWEEEFLSAAKDMIRPFFGTDILAGALIEVYQNKKQTGGPIYNTDDSPAQRALDMAGHVSKAVEPGIIGNARRVYKAVEEPITPYGKVYTLEDEAAAFFGFRTTTFDPRTALKFRSYEILERRNEATSQLKKVLRDPNKFGDEGVQEAVERSLAMRQRTFDEALRLISASRAAGMTDFNIQETLKANGFGRLDLGYLMQGQVPPMLLSAISLKKDYMSAFRALGPEKAQQVAERYGIASEILAGQFEQ